MSIHIHYQNVFSLTKHLFSCLNVQAIDKSGICQAPKGIFLPSSVVSVVGQTAREEYYKLDGLTKKIHFS